MLQDLEQRGTDTGEEANYQPPKSPSRKLITVAVLLVATVVFYLLFRTIKPGQLDDIMGMISDSKPQPVAPTKKVLVNEEFDRLMPIKNATPETDPLPEKTAPKAMTAAVTDSSRGTLTEPPKTDIAKDINNNAQIAGNVNINDSVDDARRDTKVLLNPQNAPPANIVMPAEPSIPSGELSVSRAEATTSENQIASLLALGTEAAQNQNFGKATVAFDAILELDPTRHDVRKRLSVVLYSQNRDNRVVSLLQDGIILAPERADLRLMLGRLWHRQQKPHELYEVLKPLDPNVDDNSEYLELKASAAADLEFYPEAENLYRRLANHSPQQSRWWLGLAIAQDKQGKVRDALEAYLRASESQQLSGSVTEFINKRIAVLGG